MDIVRSRLDPEPRGIERRKEEQDQHRANRRTADQCIGHRSPEDRICEWDEGQDGGKCGQDHGPRALHRGFDDGVIIVEAGSQMLNPTILALGFAIGLLSSVIPYSFELIALRRIPPRVFSILMSLEPAAAAFAAMIVLGEFLSLLQWLAMACVVIASIGATRTSTTLDQPAPD